MARHTAIDLNHIKRIAALLLALALLAERAAARPAAVRIFVHWLLLNAQFAALTLFVEPAEIDAAREACSAPSGGELPRRSAMPRQGREVHGTWRDTSASQALPGPEPPLPLLPSGEKVAA